ncbi:MAG: hypothetical protein R2799_15245 [Crocinitomicaceae bacterium]
MDWEFTIRWNFGSGMPFTQTAGVYQRVDFSGGVTTDQLQTIQNTLNSFMEKLILEDYLIITEWISQQRFSDLYKNDLQLDLQVSVTIVLQQKKHLLHQPINWRSRLSVTYSSKFGD